jgi:hypothetical protein
MDDDECVILPPDTGIYSITQHVQSVASVDKKSNKDDDKTMQQKQQSHQDDNDIITLD